MSVAVPAQSLSQAMRKGFNSKYISIHFQFFFSFFKCWQMKCRRMLNSKQMVTIEKSLK